VSVGSAGHSRRGGGRGGVCPVGARELDQRGKYRRRRRPGPTRRLLTCDRSFRGVGWAQPKRWRTWWRLSCRSARTGSTGQISPSTAARADQAPSDLRSEFPWGRLGTAEEVADVVAFVLSERANWINGANIAVDGGQGRPGAF